MLYSFCVLSPGGIFSFSFLFFFFFTKVHLFYRYLRVVVYDEKIYSNASPPSLRKQQYYFRDTTIGFPWKCQMSGSIAKCRQISQATNPSPSHSMLLS